MKNNVKALGARKLREPIIPTGHWHRVDYVLMAGLYYGLIENDRDVRQRFMNIVYHEGNDKVYVQLSEDMHHRMEQVNKTELYDLLFKDD